MERTAPEALTVFEIARRIDGRAVLAGASLHVTHGTIVGLLGPNGAGKTSLQRAVAGRLRLDAGEVRIAGLSPADARGRGQLGIVPQDIALFAHLTVEENLTALGRLAGVPPPDLRTRVREGLAWAGLENRADAIVTTLSGGMRRRVNLVAGVLHRPSLLLLDEPTVGVDPQSRNAIFSNLETLKARGKGLLYTTHYMEEVERLADRVVIVDHGRVVASDTLEGLQRHAPAGTGPVSLEAIFLALTGRRLRD